MINLNKLLMSAVMMTAVVVKAVEAPKSEVEQKSELYADVKNLLEKAMSQENVDTVKDYTHKALEQTEEAFTQYPMYIPAAFFFGRASMAAKTIRKVIRVENLPKNLLQGLQKTKSRNMNCGLVLSALHLYYNRNEKPVQKAVILENKIENVTLNNQPVNWIQA